jgi:hypothetical protein
MSFCPSVYLFICISQHIDLYLPVYLYLLVCTAVSVYLSIYLPTSSSVSVYLFINTAKTLFCICQPIHLYLPRCSWMSACLFYYLPTYSSVRVYLFIKFRHHVRHYMSNSHLVLFPSAEQRDMVELWLRPVTQNCTVFKNRSHVGYIRRLWRVPWEAANPPQ